MKSKTLILKCDCGHPGYIEFLHEDDGVLWVMLTDRPKGFWGWLRMFGQWNHAYGETMLYKDKQKELISFLTEEKPNEK